MHDVYIYGMHEVVLIQTTVLCAWCGRWLGGALLHTEQAEFVMALLSGSWALIPFP